MAKRTYEVKKIDDSFQSWLKENHYLDRAIGFQITENWQEIVGNTIYTHTAHVKVVIPKIYLRIDNSSLRELLFMDKHLLINKVNEYLKRDVIQEIVFS